jgi:SAM-dependent methyltransferase
MTENKLICRICHSDALVRGKYPDIHFNNKVFSYYKCKNCSSYNVFPNPTPEDFEKIYGEEDHTYLKSTPEKIIYNFNYPFAHHQGYQIKFLNQIKQQLKGKSLLDFACGSGFYLKYAEQLGAKVVGIEFDEKFVKLLTDKTDLEIYTLDKALEIFHNKPFDYIHLGHILEHLTDPVATMDTLKKLAHKDTVFIADGPLEKNACIARFYIDFGSRIKGKKFNNFAPQHLSLTTQKSQLLFFEKVGLKKEKYIVVEQYFPLPSSIGKSIGASLSFLIGSCSILLSMIIPRFGNVFHYRGKLK